MNENDDYMYQQEQDEAAKAEHEAYLSAEGEAEAERAQQEEPTSFQVELERLINMYSKENGSNTPDYILAEYLAVCLVAFDTATRKRDRFYGRDHGIKTVVETDNGIPF